MRRLPLLIGICIIVASTLTIIGRQAPKDLSPIMKDIAHSVQELNRAMAATGAPMVAFHIALENPWVLNTWDKSMVPKPFSRALLRVSSKIHVPEDSGDAERERYHAELQAALDRVREFAEANVTLQN